MSARRLGSSSRARIASPSATASPGSTSTTPVAREVGEPADARRDHRSPVGHRLARRHAVALTPRRDADDRGALVVRRRAPTAATKPTASGTRDAQRAVADDHARQALRRLDELEDPLLLAQPPGEEDVRRVGGLTDALAGCSTPVGTTSTRARRAREPRRRESVDAAITVRAPRSSGRTSAGARRASSTSVPHTCSTYGFPVARAAIADGIQCACTRSASRAATRAARAYAARNAGTSASFHGAPRRFWAMPAAVGDPEVLERRRRDDVDLDAQLAHSSDGVGDEPPRDVVRVARVRRRQDDDLHSRRAKTTGIASASAMKT